MFGLLNKWGRDSQLNIWVVVKKVGGTPSYVWVVKQVGGTPSQIFGQ